MQSTTQSISFKNASQIKAAQAQKVMALEDVVGVGVGGTSGAAALTVFLRRENEQSKRAAEELLRPCAVDFELMRGGRPL